MYNIVVCDDEKDIAAALEIYLAAEGYRVLKAENGREALSLAAKEEVHLMLLDIMMPQMDGLETLAKLREFSNIPVIFLTAKGEDTDKILGLNIGADDYITKPFAIEELLARIRAALRSAGGRQESQSHQFTAGPVTLDPDSRKVTVNGAPVELTRREFDLLACLLEHKGKVLSRSAILNTVWGYDYVGETNTVDVYIRFLRSKLDEVFGIHLIETVRGVGYVIRGD